MKQHARLRPAIVLLVGLLACASLCQAALCQAAKGGQTEPAQTSHSRMLALLDEIRKGTDTNNIFLGTGPTIEARKVLADLEPEAPAAERWRALLDVAEEELRIGNEQTAIGHFENAHRLIDSLPTSVSKDDKNETILRLAVAHLRYGETVNCHHNSSAEACILPISSKAVHTDKTGSRAAMHYLNEFLSKTPPNKPRFVGAVWLLNVAAMTLGEHPNGLDARYRLPVEQFGSSSPFPHFDNLAPSLGVDSFNLSGGVVFDDLDGDLDLDLFTTTSDESASPRLFLNQGDSTFQGTNRSSESEGSLRWPQPDSRRLRQRRRHRPLHPQRGLVGS